MKIKVRTIERKFTIYIPNFLLTSGVRIANFVSKSLVENNVSKDGMDKVNEYMNALDMDFILVAMKELKTVSYTHLTLPTTRHQCRSRWSPYH